jgi:hypothetical protein
MWPASRAQPVEAKQGENLHKYMEWLADQKCYSVNHKWHFQKTYLKTQAQHWWLKKKTEENHSRKRKCCCQAVVSQWHALTLTLWLMMQSGVCGQLPTVACRGLLPDHTSPSVPGRRTFMSLLLRQNKSILRQAWRLIPVIPATREAQMGKMVVWGKPS